MLNLNGAKRGSLNHEQWKAKFTEIRLLLQNEHGVPARRAGKRARAIMEQRYGKQPPTKLAVILKAAIAYARRRDDMDWDWTKTAWKSIRGAAAGIAATTLVPALALAVHQLALQYDEAGELAAAGVPGWLAPVLAIIVIGGASWFRDWFTRRHPGLNVFKKAGSKVRPALNPNAKP